MYQGQLFRSRLEARWASFFDSLGWVWEYEPLELNWYIPDFILRFHKPVLVEVKPELDLEALRKHTAKIARSGWDGEALIVGACLFSTKEGPQPRDDNDDGYLLHRGHRRDCTAACLGLTTNLSPASLNEETLDFESHLGEFPTKLPSIPIPIDAPDRWNEATFQMCPHCDKFSFFDAIQSYHCRLNGCYEGNHSANPIVTYFATHMWRNASNTVQWKSRNK